MTNEEKAAAEHAIEAHEAEVAKQDQEELAGFEAEFGDPSTPKEIPSPAEIVSPVVEKPEEIVYAQLTPAQLDDILAKANTVPDVRAEIKRLQDSSAGRIGSLEHIVKTLQANTPVGKPLVVTPDMLKQVSGEYEDLGKKLAEDLTAVFSQFKGTGEATQLETQEEFAARVAPLVEAGANAALEKERRAFAYRILSDRHEDYEVLMGIDGAVKETSPWKNWLKTQPADYATKMLNSWDGFTLAKSLDTFKAHEKVEKEKAEKAKKVTPKAPDARAQIIREAIPARGGSIVRTTAEAKTEEDAFAEETAKMKS
jgi:hypothetical protein